MDDVTEIRRRVARGESMRAVAASLGVSRNTVRRYVEGAPPETRRPAATPRTRPKQEVCLGAALCVQCRRARCSTVLISRPASGATCRMSTSSLHGRMVSWRLLPNCVTIVAATTCRLGPRGTVASTNP